MQKKIELLAPAGNMDALKAAVAAGCDAVYLGGTGFSARAFAGNFDHEEMVQAITYCHIHGVKV
ncbi:MAG: peptidase, partial [Solobacterium sp.]|nr:peptidase [Solobacterium sp.]